MEEDPLSQIAGTATDLEWHIATAHVFCGGCGLDDCHPEVCCTEEKDRMGMLDSVCGYCKDRYATGQILTRREVIINEETTC